jgi:hypothetical protein
MIHLPCYFYDLFSLTVFLLVSWTAEFLYWSEKWSVDMRNVTEVSVTKMNVLMEL